MRMLLAVGAVVMAGAGLVAQSQLAQLGLTETAARTFVLDEIKGPAGDRAAPIGVAGTRAFLKLPPAARGPAGAFHPPGLVKGPTGARSLAAATNQTIVVTESGRIWTWGHVRQWTRPGGGGLSSSPILLWIDGLELP